MNLHHNNATMAGAVFISGDYANIFNTDFYYNEALASKNVTAVDGLGGALYIVGQNATMSNTEFNYNKARNGSAICFRGSGSLTNMTFLANQA